MLVLLLVIAAWAWWSAHRRGSAPWQAFLKRPGTLLSADAAGSRVRIIESARFDAGARVHVVEWRDQQLLVAVNGASTPVLLARHDAGTASSEHGAGCGDR